MKQRNQMCKAIEDSKWGKSEGPNMFYLEGHDVFYLGCEYVGDDGNTLTWYLYPCGQNEAIVFLYISDSCFDAFVDNLEDSNIKACCEAWPLLMQAVVYGLEDDYRNPALIKLQSTEASESTFWCMAMKVENIDFSKEDDLWGDYVLGKVKLLVQYLAEMNQQLEENEPSNLTIAWEGIKSGIKTALTINRVIKLAGWVAGLPIFAHGDE